MSKAAGIGFAAGLLAGLAIGVGASGRGGSPASGAKPEDAAAAGDPEARALVAEKTLAAERDAHARCRSARVIAEAELSRAREQLAFVSRPSRPGGATAAAKTGAGGAGTGGDASGGGPGTKDTSGGAAAAGANAADAADPAAKQKRLAALEKEADDAMAKKDGKRALAALKELSSLGKDGWAAAKKLGTAIATAIEEGDGGGLGVSGVEYLKAIAADGNVELYADALLHPQGYDVAFRHQAVWGVSLGDASGGSRVLLDALRTESDETVARMMAGMVAQSRDPSNIPGIVGALAALKDGPSRLSLATGLAEIPGDQALAALRGIAAGDPDPGVRKAADTAVKVREATVAGYLLTDVAQASQAFAQGLREGDVVTTFRGTAIPNQKQLGVAMTGWNGADPAPCEVWRQGQRLTVPIKGHFWAIGAVGRFTRPPS